MRNLLQEMTFSCGLSDCYCYRYLFWLRLKDVLPRRRIAKTDFSVDIYVERCVLKTKTYDQGEYICRYWSWSRRFQNSLKTSSKHNVKTKTKQSFKTSARRLHRGECLLGSLKKVKMTIAKSHERQIPIKDYKKFWFSNT